MKLSSAQLTSVAALSRQMFARLDELSQRQKALEGAASRSSSGSQSEALIDSEPVSQAGLANVGPCMLARSDRQKGHAAETVVLCLPLSASVCSLLATTVFSVRLHNQRCHGLPCAKV